MQDKFRKSNAQYGDYLQRRTNSDSMLELIL